jgi:hypothetical protein
VQYSAIQNALRFHKRKESLTEEAAEGRIDPESLRIRHNIYCAAYIVDACSLLLGVGGVNARVNARYMYLQSGLKKKYPSRRPSWATDL